MIEEIEVDDAGNELGRNYRYLQNQDSLDKEMGKKIDTKGKQYEFGGYGGSIDKNRLHGANENNIRSIIENELEKHYQKNQMGYGDNPYGNKGPNGMPFSSGQMILYKHLTDKMYFILFSEKF